MEFRLFLQDLIGTWKLAKRNDLKHFSAAIAFYCVSSIFPFLILLVFICRSIVGIKEDSEAWNRFCDIFETLFPSVTSFLNHQLVPVLEASVMGNFASACLLAWCTYELFLGLHRVFEKISERGENRTPVLATLTAMVCFSIVSISSSLFIILTTADSAHLQELLRTMHIVMTEAQIVYSAPLVALFLVLGSLTAIFKLMPTQDIETRFAFKAAILFLLLFLVGRVTYAICLGFYRHMNERLYGGFFSSMVVLVWILYLSSAFLYSAQFSIYLEENYGKKLN